MRLQETGQRQHHEHDPDADRVLSFAQWIELIGVSRSAGWRLLNGGGGPKVTQLSKNRVGIQVRHNREWLASRVRG